ncbi:NADH-quinone oxidoreductase subunit N [Candidatus Protochlamydia sp. R18]|uniref:NADH-quinone oxidoreductase subunit N n=1 Tax=Candidatus Protochlamydia sp. R18 TaxID=1353977 RepID=UPI0005AA1C18|nr:NADH-quinone oxidoreductase subunit N [Candidatus Protochlamydia sp. R18]
MNPTLTLTDFISIGPLLIVLMTALIIILIESFSENCSKKWSSLISIGGLTLSIFAVWGGISPNHSSLLNPWIHFDSLARFFTVFFLVIGIGASLLATAFFQRFKASHGEYFFLLQSAVFGLILIGAAADLLTLFLGIETLSISLYVLCGYMKKWEISHESSFKYFLMGSIVAGFLLYGIALVYGAIGTTRLDVLLSSYQTISLTTEKVLFFSGIAMITLGLAFKAALVPFHTWSPDVYAGASNPVTAFMAVGTKVGVFAAFVRLFFEALPQFDAAWNQVIDTLVYATLIYANFVALKQIQLRRFFAYSSISHAGFLMIPVVIGNQEALSALTFYLVIYAIATFGCFAVLAYLDQNQEGVHFSDLHGLFGRSPWLASLLSICLLTLAGIPPTAGFLAKFYVFKVAFQAGYYGLVIVGLLTTILSSYYYLRIIGILFSESKSDEKLPYSMPAAIVGTTSFIAIIILSFYPAPFLKVLSHLSN